MRESSRSRLQARISRGAAWTALRLDGIVDEHNGLDQVLTRLDDDVPHLLVDLGRVRRINSVGVRDWVHWLRDVRKRYAHVTLFDCTPAVMNEVNLVRNFAEGALISTFQAPYYCDRCGEESVQLLDARKMIAKGEALAPAFPCGKPACANALDDAEESYFAFFSDQKVLTPPADLDRTIAAAREALDDSGANEAITLGGAAGAAGQLIGVGAVAKEQTAAERAKALLANAPTFDMAQQQADAARGGRRDMVFIGVVVLMLGVLGVLVYLITTLGE